MSAEEAAAVSASPDVVVIDDVSKSFVIRKDNSIKERLVTMGRGKAHQERFDALKGVSFAIPAGSSIGLLGPNGSGKSTLLKIIGGIIDPSGGSVRRRGRLAALLELGAGFHPDLSGRDNVYLNASILGLTKEETDARFDSIVDFSEIGDFIDTQVKFYSSGMYVRLAFAVAVHTDPDVLLVDEVLAVGDEAFQRKCMDKIRQFQKEGRTIILVSHSASQVMEVCDTGVVLDRGHVAYIGSAAEATKAHREILEGRRKENVEAHEHNEDEGAARPSSRITGVTVFSQGEPATEVLTGSAIEVRITVDHDSDVDTWHSSLSIDTPHGQQVFGSGTRRQLTSHGPTDRGLSEVRYQFPHINFAGGQYFINVEIADGEGTPQDVLWQGATFFVPIEFRQTGTVNAEVSITDVSVD
ncbi:ABC transporter ATP-binding protein [Microbacterium sediminicola]|uniref:ABC transporter ATP-binding protein n=1 Tax=Microbacterium sediminicola TaxID=415210 RepID=A0ABP4TJN5_9MICO